MIASQFEPDPHEPEDLLSQLRQIPKRSFSAIHGGARRASVADLKKYLVPAHAKVIPSFQGMSLALENPRTRSIELIEQQNLYLPDHVRERNVLVFGPIGTGKTQGTVYPSIHAGIMDRNASNFIISTKDDDSRFIKMLVEQHRPSTKVVIINFADRSRSTTTWNPFDVVSKDEPSLLNDIQTFIKANHVSTDSIDSFWDGTASRIIAGICQRLEQNFHGRWSPADIHQILELPRQQLLTFLKEGPALRFALSSAAFLESGSHNAETALAFAQSYMRCFCDVEIAAATASRGFDHEDLFKEPTVVILEVPLRDQQRIRPLLNLFVTQLLRRATAYAARQQGNRLPHPLNVFMDDFPLTTGRIEELPQQLNLVRSIGVRVLAAAHSIGSIEHFFGTEASLVLAGFSTKVFMSPVELSDAEWASRNSGSTTVDFSDESEQPDASILSPSSSCGHIPRPLGRKLLLPDEVRLAPRHPSLGRASTVFLADEHVFQGWFVPAYKQRDLASVLKRLRQSSTVEQSHATVPLWTPLLQASAADAKRATLSPEEMRRRHEELKESLFTGDDSEEDRAFWRTFEKYNLHTKPELCVKLAEEIISRKATIGEYRQAITRGNTENCQAVLHFMDYWRLKDRNGSN